MFPGTSASDPNYGFSASTLLTQLSCKSTAKQTLITNLINTYTKQRSPWSKHRF